MSGLSAATMASSVSSLASTVSATLPARPCARAPKARAASSPRLRGLGAKNTKPTRSAPDSSAASSASGVFRPQILIDKGMIRRVLPPSHAAAKQNRGAPLRRGPRDYERVGFVRSSQRLGRGEAAADILLLIAKDANLGLQLA